ncbi:MAG: prepilin-type N-terminal cleavage/methylation domain-containing protein [Georgfuchsia sp.]
MNRRFAHLRPVNGFTLIELIIVLTIIALLLSIASPRYFHSVDKSKETVLRSNLAMTRDALDKYYGDNGKYPDQLETLVTKKYLRSLPLDPITESTTTWTVVAPDSPEKGGVFDIHSGAEGSAADGTKYSEW